MPQIIPAGNRHRYVFTVAECRLASERIVNGEQPKSVARSLGVRPNVLTYALNASGLPAKWRRPDDPLSPIKRTIWELVKAGLDQRQIAERMGTNPENIRTHLCQARKILGDDSSRFYRSRVRSRRILGLYAQGLSPVEIAREIKAHRSVVDTTLSQYRHKHQICVKGGEGCHERLRAATLHALQAEFAPAADPRQLEVV